MNIRFCFGNPDSRCDTVRPNVLLWRYFSELNLLCLYHGIYFPLPFVVGRNIDAMFLAPLPYTQSTVPALGYDLLFGFWDIVS